MSLSINALASSLILENELFVIAVKEILEEEKSVVCVIASEGLMDHI